MKKRCQICGKSTHEWERVNGGLIRYYPCGKQVRAERYYLNELSRIPAPAVQMDSCQTWTG